MRASDRSPLVALLPNAITLARAVAVLPVVVLVTDPATVPWALALFTLAALTDAVDGPLARRLGAATRLGAFLDPLADKVLVLGTLMSLLGLGAVDGWVVLVILGREVIVTVLRGAAAARGAAIDASAYGKAKTVLQAVAVSGQLVALAFPWLGVIQAADATLAIAAAVTVATGIGVLRRALAPIAAARGLAVAADALRGSR